MNGVGHRALLLASCCLVFAKCATSDVPIPDQWHLGVPLTQARDWAGAAVGGDGKIYIAGGSTGPKKPRLNLVERYDEDAQTWEPVASPFSEGIYALAMATDILGRVYAIGGVAKTGITDLVHRYDPMAETWEDVAPLPVPRWGAATTDLQGYIYLVGGGTKTGVSALVHKYDPSRDAWTALPSLQQARQSCAVLCDRQGRLYAAGGSTGSSETATVERLDLSSPNSAWTYVASMHVARQSVGALGRDGLLYVVGGWTGAGASGAVERYDPETNSWTIYASLNQASSSSSAVTACSGRIYLLGGFLGATVTGRVEYTQTNYVRTTDSYFVAWDDVPKVWMD